MCAEMSKNRNIIGEDVGSDMLGYFLSPDYEQTVGGLLEELGDNNLKGELKSAIDNILYLTQSDDLSAMKADIKSHFEKGNVIALLYADNARIKALLDLLGVVGSYKSPEDANCPNVEIFGVVQRKVNSVPTQFIYAAPHLSNFLSLNNDDGENHCIVISGDIDSKDAVSGDRKPDVVPPAFTSEDFHKARVSDFLRWVTKLSSGHRLQAADDTQDLKNLTSGTVYQFPFPYTGDSHWDFTPNRLNSLTYTVYTAHAFSDGTDYILVKLDSTTNPANQFVDKTNNNVCGDNWLNNHVSGYTRKLNFYHSVDDVVNIDDVTIMASSPETLNQSHTESKGFTQSFSGSIGFSGSNPTGSFTGGVSYSTTNTTTIQDYIVNNYCQQDSYNNAKWEYQFNWASDGANHWDFDGVPCFYYGVNATNASKTSHTAHIDWIYAVKSVYWDTHEELTINAKYTFTDGCTMGMHGHDYFVWIDHDRESKEYTNEESYSFTVKRPPHVAVDRATNVDFSKEASHGSFNLLSDKDWTISADQDWVTSFNYTSSKGTGATAVGIMYDVAENTTGAIRNAVITITASDGEKCLVNISQSGN